MSVVNTAPKCHHIMDNGYRCGTPPLKDQPFCYFHRRWHADFVLPGHPAYVPPLLESRHSIQLAFYHVYLALSKNLLDRRLARAMLYNLRLAQQNLGGESGLYGSSSTQQEINPPMRQALRLNDNLEDTHVRDASPDAHRSSDNAARTEPVLMGANRSEPIQLTTVERAIQASNDLAAKKFSPQQVPEFVPELEPEEWLRVTRDLPRKGEPGTTQQQLNCRRVLQILSYDGMRRRMAGIKT